MRFQTRNGWFVAWIVAATLAWCAPSTAQDTPARTFWNHNGSTVYLVAKGSTRQFYYEEPRPGMIQAGARQGSLLFQGISTGGQYQGTAFLYKANCGTVPYKVSGPILDDYERVIVKGQAPVMDSSCRIQRYVTDTLEFTLLKPDSVAVETATNIRPSPVPTSVIHAAAPIPTNDASPSISVPMDDGTSAISVLVNDAVTLKFVVDTRAANVSIPADVILTLIRTGALGNSDFIGSETYRLADGSTLPSSTFRIRSLKLGNKRIENVTGNVATERSTLLLGQSFLDRFKAWSIDENAHLLVLNE